MVNQRIKGKDVLIHIDGVVVGGAEELTLIITRENTIAHEMGTALPAEIVEGNISINGSITRPFIDVDLLNQLMPSTSLQTAVNIFATIISGKTPTRDIKVSGVKFKSIDVTGLGGADYAKNKLDFDATFWEFVG